MKSLKLNLRFALSGLAAAFLSVVLHASDLPAGSMTISRAQGAVAYKLAGTDAWLPATTGVSIPQGASVKTGANSLAVVSLSTGTKSVVRSNSEVEFTSFRQAPFSGQANGKVEPSVSKTQLNVKTGEVLSDVAKLMKGSEYIVSTPVGAAGVRGTIFSVIYNPSTREQSVPVIEGSVVVTLVGKDPITISAGQMLTIGADGTPNIQSLTPSAQAEYNNLLQTGQAVDVTPGTTGVGTPMPNLSIIGVSVSN